MFKRKHDMLVKNVLTYTEEGVFEKRDIVTDGDVFAPDDARDNADEVVDGEGCYAIPGLIDIHLHGCLGTEFSEGTAFALDTLTRYEASHGVTAIAPATMTLPEERLTKAVANAASYVSAGAAIVGINMEGPFISPLKSGGQEPEYIRKPDAYMFRRLQRAAKGLIKLCDMAPETEGGMDFIDELKDEVVISLAHTDADYETAMDAFNRGARHVTHMFNAMPPLSHRAPGVIGAALDSPDVAVELICDGKHVHPSAVRAAFSMFGADRVVMISDTVSAAGLPDGVYTLGGREMEVADGLVRLTRNGAIAGSITNLMEALRRTILDMGIPAETAVGAATVNPAKSIGIYDHYGSITPGKAADFVLLRDDWTVRDVFIGGKKYAGE